MKTVDIKPNPITYTPVFYKQHKFYGWLPPHQRFSFDFCFFLHDQITSVIVHGEQNSIFNHSVEVEDIPDNIPEDDIVSWLFQNGFGADACLVTFKMATLGLLSDMMAYVYESLKCASKLKTQIAYSLLRRPLKDSLYYLELMKADTVEFLKQFSFNGENPITPVEKIQSQDKIKYITEVINEYKNPFYFSPDLIYSLRYDKQCMYGLEYLFQKASHIITTCEHYRTEPTNFNFVFLGGKHRHEALDAMFFALPILLLHTLYLVLELVGSFSPFEEGPVYRSLDARNRIGFFLWYNQKLHSDFMKHANYIISNDDLVGIVPTEIFNCPNCSNEVLPTGKRMYAFYKTGTMKCFKCKNAYDPYDNSKNSSETT